MNFTPASTIEIVLASISFLIILGFALAVYFKNPKSWTNIFFFALAIVLNAYIVSTVLALHPIVQTTESQLFWIRMDMFLGAFIPTFLFLLAHTFPEPKIRLKKIYIFGIAIYTIFIAIISFTDLVFKGVTPGTSALPVPIPGVGMPFYFVHVVGLFGASFAILIRNYRRSFGQDKVRLAYFLIGIIATFTGMAVVDFLIVIFFKYSGLVFLGPNFPVFLMIMVGIAIIKHKFLDIKPAIAKAVSYAFILIIIFGLYFLALFFGLSKFLGLELSSTNLLVNTLIGVLIASGFEPIKKIVSKTTDKLFLKNTYNAEQILTDLSRAINSTINFDELANKLLCTINTELRARNVAIFLINDQKIINQHMVGYTNKNFSQNKKLFNILKMCREKKTHYLNLDDLQNDEKKYFHELDIEVFIPILAEGKYVALLVLGTKGNGLPYSKTDLNLLDVFASEAGIAIQNAKLYSDLQNALQVKNKFINTVSHQLRTPVSGIRWSLDEMYASGELDSKRELLNSARPKTIFLNEQIDDIVTALDIYDKKVEVIKSPVKVIDLCQKIVSEFKDQILNRNLQIKYAVAKNDFEINADQNKLRKVLEVVIKNAILYSNESGEINIKINSTNKMATIEVIDNGLGITYDEQSKIFTEFYRSERAKNQVPDGLGLGMFIAKTFTQAHGGEIKLQSKGANLGTTVSINLPVK